MPDRPDHICCPICNGTVFQPVLVNRPDGSQSKTRFFYCVNCTIVCLDPIALTRAFEDRPSRSRSVSSSPAIQAWSRLNQRRRERE